VPTPARVAVWPAVKVAPLTTNCVTESGSPSTSLSLASTLPVRPLSSAVVPVSGLPSGASLTAAMLKLKVLGDWSVFCPPLAVPPLSTTWKVNDPRPVPFTWAAGVKVSWPRLPAGISCPAVTATPFRRSTPCPAGGSAAMTTDCGMLAGVSAASVIGKSDAEKV
jgi:hypothetical protein